MSAHVCMDPQPFTWDDIPGYTRVFGGFCTPCEVLIERKLHKRGLRLQLVDPQPVNSPLPLFVVVGAAFRAFDPVADVAAFHSKFGLNYDGGPRLLPDEISGFRIAFMQEELDEYCAAFLGSNQAKMLDALVDLTYVVLGNAYLHGYDFREAWRRVHAANMAKVRAASAAASKRGNAHDVVKPPGWVAPDLSDLVVPVPPDPDKYFKELISGPPRRADEASSEMGWSPK